ncbi:hypothetical protein BGZ74_008886 [Mortierella antarctica]|nr:hypothetical protein BGZ74_008886 [Mortierella antarctica]
MNYTGAINHINLSCSDMIKGRAFYRFLLTDLMGYKEGREESYGTNYTRKTGEMIFISPGNTTPHHKSNPGLHHLAFSVGTHEEIDEFHTRIVGFYASHANHGHIHSTRLRFTLNMALITMRNVFFTDPDGVKLELVFSKGQ